MPIKKFMSIEELKETAGAWWEGPDEFGMGEDLEELGITWEESSSTAASWPVTSWEDIKKSGIAWEDLAKVAKEWLEAIQRSEEEPVPAPAPRGEATLWFFKGDVYDVKDIKDRYKYNDEQIQLLILEHYDKERRKFERLRQRYKSETIQRESRRREGIPEHVRIAVWRRDSGKCVRCGSRENLEYDHIIPVSKGGSNTARNIELLCERCNREKRDRIE